MNQSSKKIANWSNLREILSQSIGEGGTHSIPEKLNYYWSLIVGSQLSAVSEVDRLHSKTLYLRVADKRWILALKGLEKKIINEFNNRLKSNLVNSLSYHEDKKGFCEIRKTPLQISKKNCFPLPMPPSEAKNSQLKMVKDIGLREILWRLEQKIRFLPLLSGVFLLGSISNCATDQSYFSKENPSSRAYVVSETIHEPVSDRGLSSHKTKTNKLPYKEEGVYEAKGEKEISNKGIRERNEKYLKKVSELHKSKPVPESKDPAAYFNFLLALRAERNGDFDAATDYYRMVLAHDPSAENFYIKLVNLYQIKGQLDLAITVCRNGLERFPENIDLLLTLAETLFALGESRESLSYLERVSANTHNIKALLLSGNIHIQNKDYTQAENSLTKAVLVDPGNPLGYHFLGRNYALKKQYKEAEKSLRKALTLRPSLTNTRILLAWIMETVGNIQQAENQYKVLRKIDPENIEIKEKLAQLSLKNTYESGNQTVKGDTGPIPKDSSIYLKLGLMFFEQSQFMRALKEFRLFLAGDEDKEIRFLIVRIYELFKNYSKAIDELVVLQGKEPDSVELLLQIARMHHINENTDKAIDVLQNAVRLRPDNDQIYHSLSLAYLSKNQQLKAIEFIRKAIELNKKNATYYFELGALLEQVDQVDEAIKNMREVLRINPRHSNAHNFIGYLYALQGERLDQAIDHLEKALAVQPQNGYFLDSLGWIYFQQGKSKQALVEIKKAMIYTSPDPVIYDHLGDIYFDLKNYEEAEKAWKISLSLTNRKKEEASPEAELPNVSQLESKLQKLENLMKQSF